MRALGIILIIAGIIMMAFRTFNFTSEKTVVDAGPIEINKKESHTVGWPVWAGGAAIGAGVVLLIASRRK